MTADDDQLRNGNAVLAESVFWIAAERLPAGIVIAGARRESARVVIRSARCARQIVGLRPKCSERRGTGSSPAPAYESEGQRFESSRAHHTYRAAESGEAHYRTALALAEPRGMRPLVAHCYLGLGKLARRTGQREQAQEHLTTATTMYRDMAMRFWLEQAQAEITQTG